jgi:glycosyltransferase involved in cell wall biosynthesis
MGMEKLSVIINSYSSDQKLLSDSIASILAQRQVQVQCIISTVSDDPAIKTAKKYGVEVVLSKKPNLYQQLNKALDNITGDWFFYFSGNDIAMPNKAINEITLCSKKNKKVCYSSFYKTDSNLEKRKLMKFHDYSIKKHYCGNFVSDVATVRTDLLRKYSPFDASVGNAAFWDFWLKIFEGEGEQFVYNREPTWLYRIQDTSRHVIRKKDKNKMLQNYQEKRAMLKNHKLYLQKYGLQDQLLNIEKLIIDLKREINNG